MNGVLKASAQGVPKATLYRVAGISALFAAILGLAVSSVLRPDLGTVFIYAAVPFFAALLVWTVAGVARLRLVGFLPSDADHFIPVALQPWIRCWLLLRFGLLGAMFLLLLSIIGTAVVDGSLRYSAEALVYVVWFRMFIDLVFGAAFNLGIISRRSSAK